MVEFKLNSDMVSEYSSIMKEQHKQIEDLFKSEFLISYSISEDQKNIWAIFIAQSESQLIRVLESLDLSKFMDYHYHRLVYHESTHVLPSVSMN